jgi:ketosteroid isomerase-like protein
MRLTAWEVADRLGSAVQRRSKEMIGEVFSDDIVIWYGATGLTMGKGENLELWERVFAVTSELQYRNIRRYLIDGGVVQQHQVVGTFSDNEPLPTLEACIVMKITDDKIIRIDEYFDRSSSAELWRRLTG